MAETVYYEYDECPKCKSQDITFVDQDYEIGYHKYFWLKYSCDDCGCEFTEIFYFDHTEIDKED